MIVKLGILQDDKFYEKAKHFLLWKTTGWQVANPRRVQIKSKQSVLHDHEKISPTSSNSIAKKGCKSCSQTPISTLRSWGALESKIDGLSFQRIDGKLDEQLLDKDREKNAARY